MKFTIEQIAIAPRDPEAAKRLLAALGWGEWSEDHVIAEGEVFGAQAKNEADLSFNYEGSPNSSNMDDLLEFEVLCYTSGRNWMSRQDFSASHLGMHCTADELVQWRAKFARLGIRVAQEVVTLSHTNPVIAGKRTYNYVIFDTRPILGIDLKFIVRKS